MDAAELFDRLRQAGFAFAVVDGGRLGVAPGKLLTDDDRAAIARHKAQLVALLCDEQQLAAALVEAVNRAHADMRQDRRAQLIAELLELPTAGQQDMLAHFLEVARTTTAWAGESPPIRPGRLLRHGTTWRRIDREAALPQARCTPQPPFAHA